ncbi:carbohydrate ABC transporter permease [Bauldia sp.]|uniref:carbohydrate ABC transporter permease n=1 Tax=Bauldia sp. TaxID=2575872 RepID=UPI003BADB080
MAAIPFLKRGRSTTPGGLTTVLIFLPPALMLFTVFVILPIGEAAWYGFFNWNGLGAPDRFVGLENYGQIFENKVFRHALQNNILIIVVSLAVQLPLALAMAVLLADRFRGAVAFRMLFFLPFILADIAAGLIWRYMFDGNYGMLTLISESLGYGPVHILADRDLAFSAVLTVIVWKYFGFHMMLYIAGLQNIDPHLYEAAAIDGASPWQRFWYVTVPQLSPMIRLSIFFSLLGSLQFFDMIVALTGGGPLNSTHTIVSYLYYFGIGRMRVGFGSAVGVVLFIISVVVAFGYKRLFMRDD